MALQGPIPVRFEDVFPHGAYATGVEAVMDFEKSSREHKVQARDKVTGDLLWSVALYDADPEARHADRSIKVKIAAPVQPVLPEALPGMPFRPVEFDGLMVRPYVNGNGRLAYSYSARGVKAPKNGPAPSKVQL
jgi:hypothetical protein